MATQTRTQHVGILAGCELVRSVPNYLKMKATKAVAGKLALAARTDHVNVESGRRRTADVGRKFREDLRTKFGKWEEPDKAQVVKALPNFFEIHNIMPCFWALVMSSDVFWP